MQMFSHPFSSEIGDGTIKIQAILFGALLKTRNVRPKPNTYSAEQAQKQSNGRQAQASFLKKCSLSENLTGDKLLCVIQNNPKMPNGCATELWLPSSASFYRSLSTSV